MRLETNIDHGRELIVSDLATKRKIGHLRCILAEALTGDRSYQSAGIDTREKIDLLTVKLCRLFYGE